MMRLSVVINVDTWAEVYFVCMSGQVLKIFFFVCVSVFILLWSIIFMHAKTSQLRVTPTVMKPTGALAGWMNLKLVQQRAPTQEEQSTCAQGQLRRSRTTSPASSLLKTQTHTQPGPMTKAIHQRIRGLSLSESVWTHVRPRQRDKW